MARKKDGEDRPLIALEKIEKIPAVTRACNAFLRAREAYAAAGLEAKNEKQRVMALFEEHNLPGYICKGKEIRLKEGKTNLEVIEIGAGDPDDDDQGNDDE